MSALLSKLNLDNLVIVDPNTALTLLASRGEWKSLCRAIAAKLNDAEYGSLVKFEDIGLDIADFERKTATKTKAIGDVDYQGVSSAAREFGLLVKTLTNGNRAFYLPRNRDEIVANWNESRAKAAAKAKAKAKAKKS